MRKFLFGFDEKHSYVDLSDPSRQQAIRESDYQQDADAGSRVLRVKGKVSPPVLSIKAITTKERI